MLPLGSLVRDKSSPELGVGRVVRIDDDRHAAEVLFETAEEPRIVRPQEDGVVRLRLTPGLRIGVTGAAGDVVAEVLGPEAQEESSPWTYRVVCDGVEDVVSEVRISPLGPKSDDPRDLLEALRWRGGFRFFARWNLQDTVAGWYGESEGLPGLLGARARVHGHHVHAVRRVLWARAPRFVLANELGTGTTEVGLILQALQWEKPELRVLLVSPGARGRQWLHELFLRFGARVYTYMDATRLRETPETLWPTFLESERLIVSTSALSEHPAAGESLLAQEWDMVVVDGAHRARPGSDLFAFLQRLSRRTEGLLALSAPPSAKEVEALQGLLALVAPDAYDPARPHDLRARIAAKRPVWAALDESLTLLESGGDPSEVASCWDGILPDDPVVAARVERLRAGVTEAGWELADYVREFHRIDPRIVRTRHATLRELELELAPRSDERLDYTAGDAELRLASHLDALPAARSPEQRMVRRIFLRAACTTPRHLATLLERRLSGIEERIPATTDLAAALRGDPGPGDEELLRDGILAAALPMAGEESWLHTALQQCRAWEDASGEACARFVAVENWLTDRLASDPAAKVLVFSQERDVVNELCGYLAERLGDDMVGGLHHGLDDASATEIAQRFQRDERLRVLVCDELGGEGRDLGIAEALVHLDQPASVARLERRVGRLDRLGRDPSRPVHSVVMAGPVAVEQALLRLNTYGFQVTTRPLGGLGFMLPALEERIAAATCDGAEQIDQLGEELEGLLTQELEGRDEAFERGLDPPRRALREAAEFAEVLEDSTIDADAPQIRAWAKIARLSFSNRGNREWSLGWKRETLARPLPGLGEAGLRDRVKLMGTLDPLLALADESLQYFAPGHFGIDAVAHDVHQGTEGRLAVIRRALGPTWKGRLGLLVIARCELGPAADGLPRGLRARARRRLWPEPYAEVVALHPGEEPLASAVTDRAARSLAEAPYAGRDAEPKVDQDLLASAFHLPTLWASVRAGADLALERVRQSRAGLAAEAAGQLAEDLGLELEFLRGVGAADALAVREALLESVRHERITVEAMTLLVG